MGRIISKTNRIIKINLNYLGIVAISLLGSLGFLFLETNLPVKISMVILVVLLGYLSFILRNETFLVFTAFFLGVSDLYNLYHDLLWPLWVIMLVFVAFNGLVSYLLSSEHKTLLGLPKQLVYICLEILILTEILLSLIPWSIDPKAKGIMLLTILYLYWEIISIHIKEPISIKKAIFPLAISLIVLSAIIVTSPWYGY